MSIEEIYESIPHREPFLLVDEIVERTEDRIVCRKTFREDEWFYAGHYPSFPITPGVLLCEAAMQAGAILLSRHETPAEGDIPVAAGLNNVRFRRMVKPGDTIEIEVKLTNRV
jgi:3-hydroxyacyl-[acyl-carrier-protein] dehydratase